MSLKVAMKNNQSNYSEQTKNFQVQKQVQNSLMKISEIQRIRNKYKELHLVKNILFSAKSQKKQAYSPTKLKPTQIKKENNGIFTSIQPSLKSIKISKVKSEQKLIKNPINSQNIWNSETNYRERDENQSNQFSSKNFLQWCQNKQRRNGEGINFNNRKTSQNIQVKFQKQKNNEIYLKTQAYIKQSQFLTSIVNVDYCHKKMVLFGLIEGHGQYSQKIIRFLKQNLQQNLQQKLKQQKHVERAIQSAFESMFQQICDLNPEQMLFSGAIASFCLIKNRELFTFNIGNNKIIIGIKDSKIKKGWTSKQLSFNHYLIQEEQNKRILSKGGKIVKSQNANSEQGNQLKVYTKKNGSVYWLSISRSFGDSCLAHSGIIPIPDVNRTSLGQNQKIVFIGQESIFQFINQDQIIETCSIYYGLNKSLSEATNMINRKLIRSMPKDQWCKQDFGFLLVFLD